MLNQNNTQSILFVVLGETMHELELARGILCDTEICTNIYLEDNGYAVEQSVISAMNRLAACRMVVIAAAKGGAMLQGALKLAKLAKDRGLLAVVETPYYGKVQTESLSVRPISLKELMTQTDCMLCATEDQFYHDVQRFQLYLTSVLDGNDFIYLDFDDISSVLKDSGFAYLGEASFTGVDIAARKLGMASVELLSRDILANARGVIMHIVGSEDIGLEDVEAVVGMVQSHTHPDGVLIFGAGFDSDLHQEIRVSVLAAGFRD